MLKCREVTRMVAADAIGRAGILRRLELRLHLMMCHRCRAYVREIGLIGNVARHLWGSEAEDVESAASVEQRVLQAIRGAAPTDSSPEVDPEIPPTD